MNISLRRVADDAIEILIQGLPLPIINAIRRYALAKVPTMAVDEVAIIANTSALFDEILAHRLAMIPLYSEIAIKKYADPPPEVCAKCTASEAEEKPPAEVCKRCFVHLYLEAEAIDRELVVYSGDIKSEDPDVYPVYNNIPIVMLAPGQKILLELRARLGRGLEHAKWSPATVAVSRYVATIEVDEKRCNLCGKCVEVCPRKVLEFSDSGIKVRDIYECILCKQCVNACPNKAIDVIPKSDEYILYIESSGALKPVTIVREAANILISELEELLKKVVEWRGRKVTTQ